MKSRLKLLALCCLLVANTAQPACADKKAKHMLQKAKQYLDSDPEKTMQLAEEIFKVSPDYMRARMVHARAALRAGKYQAAVDDCTFVLKSEKRAAAYQHRGEAYLQMSRPKDALKDLNEALKMAPEPDIYKLRAQVYRSLKKNALAKADDATAHQMLLKGAGSQVHTKAQSRFDDDDED